MSTEIIAWLNAPESDEWRRAYIRNDFCIFASFKWDVEHDVVHGVKYWSGAWNSRQYSISTLTEFNVKPDPRLGPEYCDYPVIVKNKKRLKR